MLLEGSIVALVGLAWWRAGSRKPPELTPERKDIFDAAMNDLHDAGKLRDLASSFHEAGLTSEANALRMRANLEEVPEPLKKARRAAYRKAMTSHDPDAVADLAKEFEKIGALGAARDLRTYSRGLRAAQSVPVASPPVPSHGVPPPPTSPVPGPVPDTHEEPQKPETDVHTAEVVPS